MYGIFQTQLGPFCPGRCLLPLRTHVKLWLVGLLFSISKVYATYLASVSRQLAFPGGPVTLFLVSSLLCPCKPRPAHSQAQPTNVADTRQALLLRCGLNTAGSP